MAVDCFGLKTSVTSAHAWLHERSGAPIIPIFSVRTNAGKVKIFIEDAITVDPGSAEIDGVHPAMLQLARIFEKYIRCDPTQWLLLDKAFCEDMEARRKN